MHRRALIGRAAQLGVSMLALGGCRGWEARQVAPTPAVARPVVLRVGLPGSFQRLDPALLELDAELQIGLTLFEGLVWLDSALAVQPLLATSWEQSPDLLEWTFHLRRDVTFHHGTPFSARDVVFTFERLLAGTPGSPLQVDFIQAVRALDAHRVRFTLHHPHAELLMVLASPNALIVAHDTSPDSLAARPTGTGPFRVQSYTMGERITLARNPTYWQPGIPRLAGLEYHALPQGVELAAFRAGTVDLLTRLNPVDAGVVATEAGSTILAVPSGAYQTVVMQADEPPFDDNRVRQALKHCLDRPALLQRVWAGQGVVGYDHPIPPISPFWGEVAHVGYDPDRARALLAEAGYGEGLRLELVSSTVEYGMMELALALQEMAAPAGITIEVIRVPDDVFWSDYWAQTPFQISSVYFYPSIDQSFTIAYHSQAVWNESQWASPTLDGLIDAARRLADVGARKRLYHQAAQLMAEEGAVIIPYFLPVIMAHRSTVRDLDPHPGGWFDCRTVTLAP